ncbi:ABC transporter permease [Mycetocola reblochoni]|uniref:ABC transporter permease n=1 Tax=Mycetocola reblochoni TaxID=331618 RepID=UPI003F95F581
MTWILANLGLIGDLMLVHLRLSLIPVVVSILVAVPLGRLAHRVGWLRGGVLSVVGLLYTIPSLALITLLPPLLGTPVLSDVNVLVALGLYGVALLTRSVADAFDAVDADVVRSAMAVGCTPLRRFWTVELPLAVPVIVAGTRVVAVSTVSLVTVGALVGSRNLGSLFTDGLQRGIVPEIVAGIVATVVLALVLDLVIAAVGRALTPWARVSGTSGAARRASRRRAHRAEVPGTAAEDAVTGGGAA